MTVTTRLSQIILEYRRSRIGVREDTMTSVTRSAISHGQVACSTLQPVIGVYKRPQLSGGNTVLLIQVGRFVARGACGLGNPGRADPRDGIARRYYAMLTVTVRAHRCINLSLSD